MIHVVRDDVAGELIARFRVALPADTDGAVVETLMLTFSGAMLQAGMGYFAFDGVVDRLAVAVTQLDFGHERPTLVD